MKQKYRQMGRSEAKKLLHGKENKTERAAAEWMEILSGVLRRQKTHHRHANIGFSLLLMHLRL